MALGEFWNNAVVMMFTDVDVQLAQNVGVRVGTMLDYWETRPRAEHKIKIE